MTDVQVGMALDSKKATVCGPDLTHVHVTVLYTTEADTGGPDAFRVSIRALRNFFDTLLYVERRALKSILFVDTSSGQMTHVYPGSGVVEGRGGFPFVDIAIRYGPFCSEAASDCVENRVDVFLVQLGSCETPAAPAAWDQTTHFATEHTCMGQLRLYFLTADEQQVSTSPSSLSIEPAAMRSALPFWVNILQQQQQQRQKKQNSTTASTVKTTKASVWRNQHRLWHCTLVAPTCTTAAGGDGKRGSDDQVAHILAARLLSFTRDPLAFVRQAEEVYVDLLAHPAAAQTDAVLTALSHLSDALVAAVQSRAQDAAAGNADGDMIRLLRRPAAAPSAAPLEPSLDLSTTTTTTTTTMATTTTTTTTHPAARAELMPANRSSIDDNDDDVDREDAMSMTDGHDPALFLAQRAPLMMHQLPRRRQQALDSAAHGMLESIFQHEGAALARVVELLCFRLAQFVLLLRDRGVTTPTAGAAAAYPTHIFLPEKHVRGALSDTELVAAAGDERMAAFLPLAIKHHQQKRIQAFLQEQQRQQQQQGRQSSSPNQEQPAPPHPTMTAQHVYRRRDRVTADSLPAEHVPSLVLECVHPADAPPADTPGSLMWTAASDTLRVKCLQYPLYYLDTLAARERIRAWGPTLRVRAACFCTVCVANDATATPSKNLPLPRWALHASDHPSLLQHTWTTITELLWYSAPAHPDDDGGGSGPRVFVHTGPPDLWAWVLVALLREAVTAQSFRNPDLKRLVEFLDASWQPWLRRRAEAPDGAASGAALVPLNLRARTPALGNHIQPHFDVPLSVALWYQLSSGWVLGLYTDGEYEHPHMLRFLGADGIRMLCHHIVRDGLRYHSWPVAGLIMEQQCTALVVAANHEGDATAAVLRLSDAQLAFLLFWRERSTLGWKTCRPPRGFHLESSAWLARAACTRTAILLGHHAAKTTSAWECCCCTYRCGAPK